MRNYLRHRLSSKLTTQSQLFLGVLLAILLPSLLINVFYLQLQNREMKRQLDSYNRSVVDQAGQKMDTLLSQIHVTQKQLIASAVSSENLKNAERLSPQERVNAYNRFGKTLTDIEMSLTYHAGLLLVGKTVAYQSSNNLFDMDRVSKSISTTQGGIPYMADHFNGQPSVCVIPFITEVKYYSPLLVNKIIIELFYTDLEDILGDVYLGDVSEMFLVNNDHVLLYYSGAAQEKWKDRVGTVIETPVPESSIQGYTQYTYTTSLEGWKLYAYTDVQNLSSDTHRMTRYFLLNFGASVLAAFLLSYLISRSVTRPIGQLIEKMKYFDDDEIARKEILTSNKDFQELSLSFDSMRGRIRELMNHIALKEKENSSIQLKMLQAQINPHFLYNTLEVIRSIALENHVESIEEMSRYLAKMFRYSISRTNDYVYVSDEIEHVRNYISIQKYRFGDRLQAVYSIDSSILKYRMVKFILQPIVENAILHGLDQAEHPGVVTVIAAKDGDMLEFRIIDNGIGISREKLDELRKVLQNHSESSSGIGIANVDARLRLYYGYDYGFNIESHEGFGTQITIRIPAKGEENVSRTDRG